MEKGIVNIRLKEDLSPEFKKEWKNNLSITDFDGDIKKGWETWIDLNHNEFHNGEELVYPEGNKYFVTFPLSLFEVIE